MSALTIDAAELDRRPGAFARHPEWWAYALVAAAWAWVVVLHRHHVLPALPGGAGHQQHGGSDGLRLVAPIETFGGWVGMSVAMMLPVTFPALRYVVLNTFPVRRQRSLMIFVGAFVAVVAVPGVAIAVVRWVAGERWGTQGGVVAVASLAAAAVWQTTPWKRRALLSCHRVQPLRPIGRRADRSVARFAALHALRCLRSCGPLMVALELSSSGVVAMAAATAVVVAEERAVRPLRYRLPVAVALCVLAAVVWAATFTNRT
jgi:predicted metal-binding membrane protein